MVSLRKVGVEWSGVGVGVVNVEMGMMKRLGSG